MSGTASEITGEITIARPVDVVFDYVADQTNEPHYNPRMVRAVKETPGPVGKGTRFRSAVRTGGRTAEMLIENTAYDRPRLLTTTTTMKQVDIDYTLELEPVADGTRMRWRGEVRPRGGLRLVAPLVAWLGTRQEQRIWSSLKSHLEAGAQASTTGAPSDARARRPRAWWPRRTGTPGARRR